MIGYFSSSAFILGSECFIPGNKCLKIFMQGDFDPTKTKVLHFSHNPLALSRRLHAQELDNLRDENEDLRRKIKVLEQNSTENLTTKSERADISSDDTKQVQGK